MSYKIGMSHYMGPDQKHDTHDGGNNINCENDINYFPNVIHSACSCYISKNIYYILMASRESK